MLEFRSHSSTSNRKKIVAWIALCSAIVATADGKRPAALKESRGLDEEFDALFKNVVKMPSILEYYKERRVELAVASNTTKRTVAKRADEESVPKKVKVPKNQDCGCCFETVSTSTMCPCQARNHWFCQTCVRKHAETQLFSNLSSKMQCLSMDGCKSHLNTIHLKRALSKKVKAKLSEVQYLENVEQNKKVARSVVSFLLVDIWIPPLRRFSLFFACNDISTCPKCKKSTVILPKKETFFSCPLASCAHEWCRLCNQAPHETLLCSEAARRKQVTNARTSVEEDMTGAYVRRCPQCQVAFVRESGCNKMTCPNRGCGTMSCYICRQVIQGVDHFSVSGCSLYTNSGAGDWTDRRLVQQAGDTTARRVMREIGTANEELKVNLVTPYWEDTRHMHFVWSTRSFVFVALFCKCKCQQDVAVSFHRAAVTETPPPSFLLQLLTTGARRIPRPCSQAHQLSSSERYSQGL